MKIASVGTAFPKHYYPQSVMTAALEFHWGKRLENPDMLRRLHARTGVDGRHLCLPIEQYPALDTWGKANRAWREAAVELGSSSLCRAFARAGLDRNTLGAIFFTSVTGICSPSIDALLINKLDLPKNVRRIPIFGLGCVGGAAGIARAADYVRAYPDQVAALVSVETCSLTLQHDDFSIANLISSGLFGDGSATVLVAGSDVQLPGPEIVATRSSFYPGTEEVMGWDVSEKGFRIVLSPSVPDVIREHLGPDTDALLADHGLTRSDIGAWVLHTGGPKILEATQESLGITRDHLAASWECLRKVGNLSSASVLVVLEDFLYRQNVASGTWGLLAAMGPGFCSELVLLRW